MGEPYCSDLQREARSMSQAGVTAGESQSLPLICISSESWFAGSSMLACSCLNNAFQVAVVRHLGALSQLHRELPQGQRPLSANIPVGTQHSPGHVDQLCMLPINNVCYLINLTIKEFYHLNAY